MRVHVCNNHVMSRGQNVSALFHPYPKSSSFFRPSSMKLAEVWQGVLLDLGTRGLGDAYPWDFEQLFSSALIAPFCKKKLLWPRLVAALMDWWRILMNQSKWILEIDLLYNHAYTPQSCALHGPSNNYINICINIIIFTFQNSAVWLSGGIYRASMSFTSLIHTFKCLWIVICLKLSFHRENYGLNRV